MKKTAFIILLLLGLNVNAEVKPASLFTSNMVLQRNKPVTVWGKADPGENISVLINGTGNSSAADANGNWKVVLQPMNAGGPYELLIKGKNTVVLNNVMVGEVWLCSGQSNMEFTLKKSSMGNEEIPLSQNKMIRLFLVKRAVAETPQEFCTGEWVECTPKSSSSFSAAAYYFGKELFNELNVPIGLVQATWGGTAAECWMPEDILKRDEEFSKILVNWKRTIEKYPEALIEYNKTASQKLQQWSADSAKAVNAGRAPLAKPSAPNGPGSRNTPSGTYNGMINPVIQYTFRGVIWYQGEANARNPYLYRKLFPALINVWRERNGVEDLPFYYVQLPNLYRMPEPSKSGWPELREAQLKTLSLKNTGMAVTIDIGNPANLHPANKIDVGHRLALIALANVYGKNIEYMGPLYKSKKIEGNKILIQFSHAEKGLIAKGGGKLSGFVISGSDGIYLPAEAVIEGSEVAVWNAKINNPVNVMYAWADNPECNLYNSAMLPASPFRTDDTVHLTNKAK